MEKSSWRKDNYYVRLNGLFLNTISENGAKTLLENNEYKHRNWKDSEIHKDRGKVKVDGILVVYFTTLVEKYPGRICFMYGISDISENREVFEVKKEKELKKPLYLPYIKKLVKENLLGEPFENCGSQGFNIKKIPGEDYEVLLEEGRERSLTFNKDELPIYFPGKE